MTENNHPITPSPELVAQIRRDALHKSDGQLDYELRLIHDAYRAGADQELEACCHEVQKLYGVGKWLRSKRRIESLKEQALQALENANGSDHPVVTTVLTADQHALIHKALEQLDD